MRSFHGKTLLPVLGIALWLPVCGGGQETDEPALPPPLSDQELANFKPARQSLVRRHPVTGRKSIYLSAHAGGIVGWPVPEARIFLRDLTEEATRPENVYRHVWRQYDLVIWDNRQVMHRAKHFDDVNDVRDMRRTTVAGDAQTAEQAA